METLVSYRFLARKVIAVDSKQNLTGDQQAERLSYMLVSIRWLVRSRGILSAREI
jgi:hypothetical protein